LINIQFIWLSLWYLQALLFKTRKWWAYQRLTDCPFSNHMFVRQIKISILNFCLKFPTCCVLFIWFIYKSILYKLVLYIHLFKENSAYSRSVWSSTSVDKLIIPDCPKLPVWQRLIIYRIRHNYFSRSAHHVRPTILPCTIARRVL
jgi:hypothetical protein